MSKVLSQNATLAFRIPIKMHELVLYSYGSTEIALKFVLSVDNVHHLDTTVTF